jgi:hypothetical protein
VQKVIGGATECKVGLPSNLSRLCAWFLDNLATPLKNLPISPHGIGGFFWNPLNQE